MRQSRSGWQVFGAWKRVVVSFFAVVLVLAGTSVSAFQVEVVDGDGAPLPIGFRWLVEIDNTDQQPPGIPSAVSAGVSIHKSYAPVVADGDSSGASTATVNVPSNKRYIVTAMPYEGYTLGAALVAKDQASAQVVVHQLPLPTTQISIFVFKDHGPINNAPDGGAFEPGLEGFSIQIHDPGGPMLQDAFGNPLGTTYSMTDGVFDLDAEGNPIVDEIGNGLLLTDANGEITVKYLAPGKYAVLVVPPPDQAGEWVQTATIEGTKVIDAWVKADEPSLFIEGFGPGFYHAFIGFVRNQELPWNIAPDATATGTITAKNVFNHFSRPPRLQGFYAGPEVDGCWVGLNDPVTGQGLYATACADIANPDGSVTINNVPPGTYELVVWDENLDALFGFHTVTVTNAVSANGDDIDLGNVLAFRWFGTLKGNIFLDVNENGYKDEGETGIPGHDVLLRFRNATVYQLTVSDIFGEYEFGEVFPFFKWLVVEVGFANQKATGMTAVVDFGGPVDPTDPNAIEAGLDTTGWPPEAIGTLHPQPQFVEGTMSYDPATDTISGVPSNNPNTGNNLSRTETGEVLTQAMMLFLNQTNLIDWGKNNYTDSENGGISGLVIYDVTRPNDDPVFEGQEDYEPGIPGAQVNLYSDDDGDQMIDDVNNDGVITRADVNNIPFGNFPGPEDIDRNGNGVFDWGDAINVTRTDSWDKEQPSNCVQRLPVVDGTEVEECFDNFGTWNQTRDGLFDGGYAFGSYFPNGPDGPEVSPLPEQEYIVEGATPPSYILVREEDKNVDFGETFTPSLLLLPAPCVGDLRQVPDYMSFQTDASGTLLPGIADPIEAPFAGEMRPLCDLKQVSLVEDKNAAAEFYFYTSVPKAARNVGFVNNDLAAEFDESSPIFGEKASPTWIPISYRDWAGNEVARVYSDEYGAYNAMLPSMYSNSMPSPSGFAPNMLDIILNDPGPIPHETNPNLVVIDPHYKKEFAVASWTFNYTPGQVTYTDTPIVPVAGFATLPPGAELESGPPVGTPIINGVAQFFGQGDFGSPIVCGDEVTDQQLIIWTDADTADHNFGLVAGTVQVVDGSGTAYPLTVEDWKEGRVIVTVTQEVIDNVTTGQIVVTRGDNGQSSRMATTLTVVADCMADPPIIVAQDGTGDFTTIQAAIDDPATVAGDLIVVNKGIYTENVILYKEVTLQGTGPGTAAISAAAVSRQTLDAWHAKIESLLGNDPFVANEAPGIMVLGNATGMEFVPGGPHAHIDGFEILGALAGGGIYLHEQAYETEISNNLINGNQGTFGGGITVGTPDTGITASNDFVHIHDNQITGNGGVQGGGGINLYQGSDNYLIENNLISANFSRYSGAGINHVGVSNNGIIDNNQIIFNEVFHGGLLQGIGDGGGIYIAGEVIDGDGSGDVLIKNNLIQGNLTGSGKGGGVMAYAVNSTVPEAADYRVALVNNMIVNNVAGFAGGGIYLQDAVHVDIVNNTIANNDSTATAVLAFPAGAANSTPQPAGLVLGGLSPLLDAAADFSDVNIVNNIVFNNRSFFNDASLNNNAGGLRPGSEYAAAQADPTLDYPDYWDVDVQGGTDTVNPVNTMMSMVTRTLGLGATTGPTWDYSGSESNLAPTDNELPYQFRMPYFNELVIATVIDEGGNAITVRYTPLDASAGDYHLLPSSAVIDAASTTYIGAELYPGAMTDTNPAGFAEWVDNGDGSYTATNATGWLFATATTPHVAGQPYLSQFTITDYVGGSLAYKRDNANFLTAWEENGTFTEEYLGLDFPWTSFEAVDFTGTVSAISDQEVLTPNIHLDLIGDLATDYDAEDRPNPADNVTDLGADEYYMPDAAAVTVISPNGGDNLPSGSSFPLCWEAPAIATNFTVAYKLDNDTSWNVLSTTETGPCYDWVLPAPVLNQEQVVVGVRGEEGVGGASVGIDTSDGPIRIEVLKLTDPNGGETVTTPGVYTITWDTSATAEAVAETRIEVRVNQSKPWIVLDTAAGNPGTHLLTLTNVISKTFNQAQFRVSLYNGTGQLLAQDESDGFVTIQPAAP